MGADIHSFAEVKENTTWKLVKDCIFPSWNQMINNPFNWRSYSLFGFLADVRNYSCCTPLAECKGLPEDSEVLNAPSVYDVNTSERDDLLQDGNYHSFSWFTLKELLDFDYEQTFWDRRVTKETSPNCFDGASLAEEGEGQTITYREHLGTGFFRDLEILKTLGEPEFVRVVFYFDN